MRLRGSVVIVTGASSGIGRATAARLARRGATVWAAARRFERLEALAAELPGCDVRPIAADVTDAADRRRLVDAASAETGKVDVLVNNAGEGWIGLVEDMDEADVRHLFELDVLALIHLTQAVLPGMLAARHGHVVNLASVASWASTPPISVYCAAKWAVQGFSEGLRRELIGRGVTVGTVNPGPIATEFYGRAMGAREAPDAPGSDRSTLGTELCAWAVERSIRLRHVPGFRTISAPRAVGLVRLAHVPPLAPLADVVGVIARVGTPRR